jgi:hypothetical protein
MRYCGQPTDQFIPHNPNTCAAGLRTRRAPMSERRRAAGLETRRASFWAGAVLLALAAGCQARVPAEAQDRDIVRPEAGLAIDLPEGWQFKDLYGDVVLEMSPRTAASTAAAEGEVAPAAPQPHAGSAVIHVVVIDRDNITLEQWAEQEIAESEELQGGVAVSPPQPTHLADGREALELKLRSPRAVHPLVQRVLLTVTAHRAYAVLATAPEAEWPAIEGVVNKCFNSFVVW